MTPRRFRAVAALAATLLTAAVLTHAPAQAAEPAGTPATNPAALLAPDVNVENTKAHLQQFQNIAAANGGNRASGTTGYDASVSYVQQKLQAAGYSVTLQPCTSCNGSDPNVIADWPGGATNNTVMLGAHLDSVRAGAGINDNASGSAALLEAALTLAANSPGLTRHVRFAWWADEESGLRGSQFYVSRSGTAGITAYLNFDMVGSTNAGYFLTNLTSTLTASLKGHFDAIGVPTEAMTECCSDDGPFRNAGVPTTFLSTGASRAKTTAQVQKWGGTAGVAYDSCYHSACDRYPANINVTAIDRAGDAIARAIWTLAVGDAPPTFTMALNPTSGQGSAGQTVTTTVSTQTGSGGAQTVTFSSSGLPANATAQFTPPSVTSGGSSQLQITLGSTPSGTYPITVTGTSSTATRTATYTLTVGTVGGCTAFTHRFNDSLTGTGNTDYMPTPSGSFQTTTSGAHSACLDGPTGVDFDLYLQKLSGSTWSNVAQSTGSGPDESLSYNGTAGTYRYRVYSYSGSGAYTIGFNRPA
ncbi:M28 family peptidase [Phytomonospora sp. NPDC050363]|uniref:M28 family peptidase n=1 Tax=Phytomonospora sp. NPDC050363 TaxID=3155642 RepID=UPI0033CCD708